MNTRIKIAGGAFVGLIAGAMLLGTAFATPQPGAGTAPGGYGTSRPVKASGGSEAPSASDMQSFMERYRTPDGGIDVGRMHSDIAGGKVAEPCGGGGGGTETAPETPSADTGPGGSGMMGGYAPTDGSGVTGGTYY